MCLILQSLLGVENLISEELSTLSTLKKLTSLELGDCAKMTEEVINAATSLQDLKSLRLEKAHGVGTVLGELRFLQLEKLELVDVVLKEGFGDGLVKLKSLKKVLLIPQYKDEVRFIRKSNIIKHVLSKNELFQVATINAEIVDSVPSTKGLSHFFLGLTNEWLHSMSSLTAATGKGGSGKDSFPIMVGGTCEMFSLSKLFKTLSVAMPDSRVKVLKMPQNAMGKQFIDSLIK